MDQGLGCNYRVSAEINPVKVDNPLKKKRIIRPVALILITLPILLYGCGGNDVLEEITSINDRLDKMEIRLSQLESTDQRVTRLQSEVIKLQQMISSFNRTISSKTVERKYHTVRRGDSLSRIASRYGLTLNELIRLNDITRDALIRPGQQLLVARDR